MNPRITISSVFLFCCAFSASQASAAAGPYRLRCDTVTKYRFPFITLNIGIDSLASPVTDLNDSDFTVREFGASFVPQFQSGSCEEDSLSVALVVDTSGSMDFALGTGTRMDAAKTACTNFLNRLDMPPDEVTLIAFSDGARVVQPFTKTKAAVVKAVNALSPGRGTNIYDAVTMALGLLRTRKGKRVMLFLTDGREQPDHGFAASVNALAAQAKRDSILVFTIGLFPSNSQDKMVGEPLLQQFAARAGGEYFLADAQARLIAIYDTIYMRLLTGFCKATYTTAFCGSGPHPVTVIFHRNGFSDSCSQVYDAPQLPPTCSCPNVRYIGGPGSLDGAYPNPAFPSSSPVIAYTLDRDAPVTLTLYNMVGAVVAQLVHDTESKGSRRVEIAAAGLPAGMYFYRLTVGDQSWTKSLSIVR